MSDDIQVPIIYITGDWTVDQIETEDDCDDAHAVLTALIVSIEARMDDLEIQGRGVSEEYKRAKISLRWKKAAMQVVNLKRGKINRALAAGKAEARYQEMRKFLAINHPAVFKEATAILERQP